MLQRCMTVNRKHAAVTLPMAIQVPHISSSDTV
jgi:hypothetical protein